ncbi:MAG: BMP family ABC transporter substrate-binding protein [Chloroflexi bacterium]|nr:BMP family ABC transporter substrate-binding protein [Chloroflexota bacterium]
MRARWTALLGAAVVLLLTACQLDLPAAISLGTPGPTAAAQARLLAPSQPPTATLVSTPAATPTPTPVPVPKPSGPGLSVGLVDTTDLDLNRGPMAREGLQRAAGEFNLETFAVTVPQKDLANSAMRLAEAGYSVVVIASPYPDLAAFLANRYPATKFVVFGPGIDKQPANLVTLLYAEDQAGYLAGALAAWLTQKNMIAFVGAEWTLEVVKFRKGYEHGAQAVDRRCIVLGNYIHSFSSPPKGWGEANAQFNEGADVLFAVGGSTARGAMEAAAERNLPVIAAESDPYDILPKVAPDLASAALAHYDLGVYDALKAVVQGSFRGGTLTYDVTNGGIGLGPLRAWDSKLPPEAKKNLQDILDGLRTGKVKTDVQT